MRYLDRTDHKIDHNKYYQNKKSDYLLQNITVAFKYDANMF